MADNLTIHQGTKIEKYETLLPQIESLLEDENDFIANQANIAAVLTETFQFWWTGFYRVANENELVLGPFQGPLACTRIKRGKGVCGTAWHNGETIIVADVDSFPGHIACSSASRAEIVVPLYCGKNIIGVLDIDSQYLNTFDQIDAKYLEKICQLLVTHSSI